MSKRSDLDRAREILLSRLQTDPDTAQRIADLLERRYASRAVGSSPQRLLQATMWAVTRFNEVDGDALARLETRELLAIVDRRDCPFCIGDSDDEGRTGSPTSAPPVPAGADA